jgi:hypothetical protein
MADVVDNPEQHRFEIVLDEGTAVMEYRLAEGRMVITHTGVPDELEGQGLGSQLVRAGLERARSEDLAIEPRCPYARRWIQEHPDDVDGVEILPVR